MAVIGAQLPEEQTDWKPALSGYGMEKTVAVFNPLQDDFRVQYARSVATVPGQDPNRQFARERGLPLDKAAPQTHVVNYITLKAGQTINLPGDIAQKAVQDLTTYIISTQNKSRIADPNTRAKVEKELIISVKDTADFMNRPTVEEFTEKQLQELNPEPQKEEPTEVTSKDVPNPPPGQGVNY